MKKTIDQDSEPESFHEIDKYRLDEEFERQPGLYRTYSEIAAKREMEFGLAEAALDVAMAEVEQRVRNNPEKYGIKKVVEAAIKGAIQLHTKVKEARRSVIQAKYHLGMARAAVRTLEHRKTSLEKNTELLLAGFYAVPRVKGEGGQEFREVAAEAERKAAYGRGKRRV